MPEVKLGGYIYKWGERIGLGEHIITKDKGPEIFDASKSYLFERREDVYEGESNLWLCHSRKARRVRA